MMGEALTHFLGKLHAWVSLQSACTFMHAAEEQTEAIRGLRVVARQQSQQDQRDVVGQLTQQRAAAEGHELFRKDRLGK